MSVCVYVQDVFNKETVTQVYIWSGCASNALKELLLQHQIKGRGYPIFTGAIFDVA